MVDLCDPYEGATTRADVPCRQQQKWHPMGLRAAERENLAQTLHVEQSSQQEGRRLCALTFSPHLR